MHTQPLLVPALCIRPSEKLVCIYVLVYSKLQMLGRFPPNVGHTVEIELTANVVLITGKKRFAIRHTKTAKFF